MRFAAKILALLLICASIGFAQSPPTNPQVSGVTSTTATLSWSGTESGADYEIDLAGGSGNVNIKDKEKTATLTGLSPGTNYTWKVRTVKGNKSSEWVDGPSFSTTGSPPPPPPTPSAPTVSVAATHNSATFTFDAVSGGTFDVQVATDNRMQNRVGSGSTTSTSVTVGGLSGKTKYYYEATVTVSGKKSNPTKDSFTTPDPPLQPPGPPSPREATNVTSASATLNWSTVSSATSYDYDVYSDNLGTPIAAGTSSSNSVTVNGLTGGVTYTWRVRAANAAGKSDWVPSSFRTPIPKPDPPSSLTSSSSSTGATLGWRGATAATTYDVEVLDNHSFKIVWERKGIAGTSATVTGLSSNTRYYWHVRSVNAGGESDWVTSEFTTNPVIQAPTVTFKEAATSVAFTFVAVTNATSYDVKVMKKQGNGSVVGSGSTTDPTKPVVIAGLDSKTQYDYEATATVSG
ncbi:MAG: fibronectin type III domain-containing protein, partial [Ignavibacteria bacterium]|nr:fibronectin type III domain-containing protein [Ignavibacteria bacterium]